MGWRGCHRFGDMAILLFITVEGVGAKIEGKENPALATEIPDGRRSLARLLFCIEI